LWWLLLAVLGALAWEQFSPDPGQVLVRWHGTTVVFMSLAVFLAGWGLAWFALWALWTLLRLPFTAWHRLAQQQARNRLLNGLLAAHEGRHARAEALLDKAAEDPEATTLARLGARRAALARGDYVAAATQLGALAGKDTRSVAMENAQALLAQGKPTAALDALQAAWPDGKALPPRALRLRGEGLIATGRAREALSLLPTLVADSGLGADEAGMLEREWTAASLRDAAHANELQERWQALAPPLREASEVVLAYSRRAGALGLESDAADALAEAIERQWQPVLVDAFGRLPPARDDRRLARAQAWLASHPSDPMLLLCLGRLQAPRQAYGPAGDLLDRAIAQGAGAEAWEALGHVHTALEHSPRAQLCYANALRVLRGESPLALGDRSLRAQIAAEAVGEQRDALGYPRIPG
jgi:HemY protein